VRLRMEEALVGSALLFIATTALAATAQDEQGGGRAAEGFCLSLMKDEDQAVVPS
jgi:hypothetical protein